jgi:lactocepin
MKVSWKKVSGANKYEVWKKVGTNGTYKKVKTTTSVSYKDTTTVKGKKYYYKVKAIKTANSTQNSYFSGAKYLTCK